MQKTVISSVANQNTLWKNKKVGKIHEHFHSSSLPAFCVVPCEMGFSDTKVFLEIIHPTNH